MKLQYAPSGDQGSLRLFAPVTDTSTVRIDVRTAVAMLIVVALIASMFWMKSTGNRFCCDPDSLVGQLRSEIARER